MIGNPVKDMISEGAQKIIILTDSQAAQNGIHHNEPVPGRTWASAIIRSTEDIYRQNIQFKFRWVPEHAGINGNELQTGLPRM
jgi:ribonuclease HI